jgi:hypothetical protein
MKAQRGSRITDRESPIINRESGADPRSAIPEDQRLAISDSNDRRNGAGAGT